MEATYKRRLNQSCMILEAENDTEELYELNILSYNNVPGILSVETEVADGVLRFWYDITGRQSLADYLERRKVNQKLLKQLFGALEETCRMLQDYLLEEDGILLKAEYIYMDFEQQNIRFVYLPGLKTDICSLIQELLELILQKLDHDDRQAVSAAYEMYQRSLQEGYDMFQILQWKEHVPKPEHTAEYQELEEQEEAEEPEQEECIEVIPERKNVWKEMLNKVRQQKRQWNVGKKEEELPYVVQQEVVVHPTEILHEAQGLRGILVYQGQEDCGDIKVNKPIFLIGKKEQEVDGYIKMKCISRIHARIEQVEGDYYIEDMNSTNGTYLNGERLEFHQKVQIKSRDRIAFGIAEYVFL